MRTFETILVVIIMITALTASLFAAWPSLRRVSTNDLRRIALTTLEVLDADHNLSETVFKPSSDSAWGDLQVALSSCLPSNMVYNLTVYEIQDSSETELYLPINSISNAKSLGVNTDAASYLVTANATFSMTPEKIGGTYGGTLYILNCSDSHGWWITGYSAQSLAQDVLNLLSPYFQKTIVVQNTTQFGQVLNGTALQNETLQNAVICNVFGEVVPIPQGYYTSVNVGYDSGNSSYARFCHTLGLRVHSYNWTWVSIVGYPLYYVSNTAYFASTENGFGIYGVKNVGPAGRTAFLQGLANKTYSYNSTSDYGVGAVNLAAQARAYCDYYGLYPNPSQTASRGMPLYVLGNYNLTIAFQMFDIYSNWIAGALFKNTESGSFLALGLTRVPDVRLTALGLLGYYRPALYPTVQTGMGSSRLIVLSLGRMGGM